jgi:DNA repair protein RecO (recombination protein O)
MLSKTNGIVLHTIKFGEISVIVRVYTELFGMQSYILKGARGAKSKNKMNHLAPLTLLEMDVFHKESAHLQYIREMRITHTFSSIPFDIVKSSISLFINEVIFRTVREEEPNPPLFIFLENSIRWFDLVQNNYTNFHLWFMIHFSRYLGFTPHDNYSATNHIFNLREGRYQSIMPEHSDYIDNPLCSSLVELTETKLSDLPTIHIPTSIRQDLLPRLVDFYRFHISGMKEINSLQVLHEIFS